MANIQQSVNSVLTTSAALKALGEKRELKKAEEEKRKQKEDYERQLAQNKKYIDALRGEATIPDLKESKRNMQNYSVNEEFDLAEESARSFLDESLGSFDSFMGEYNNRKSNGGNK